MNNLQSFFSGILSKISETEQLDDTVIAVVKKFTHITLEKEDFSIQDKKIRFIIHPLKKQEIFLNKKIILEKINEESLKITDLY